MAADSRPGTVIVPVDFSKASQGALSLAAAISRALKSNLLLLHVFRYVPQHEYVVPVEWMTKELLRRAKRQLNTLRRRIDRAGASAETMLLESVGDPAIEILQAAETQTNPIVVLGTHSRTGLDRFFIGSTAEEVLRNSKHPVITVGPHAPAYWHRDVNNILLATDLTERSLVPLAFLSAIWSSRSRLLVLHVANPDAPILDSSWERAIRERLNALFGERVVSTRVEFRNIVHAEVSLAIHQAAVAQKTDLIAIGIHPAKAFTSHSRPRTGFQIIMSAPCAVVSICE